MTRIQKALKGTKGTQGKKGKMRIKTVNWLKKWIKVTKWQRGQVQNIVTESKLRN